MAMPSFLDLPPKCRQVLHYLPRILDHSGQGLPLEWCQVLLCDLEETNDHGIPPLPGDAGDAPDPVRQVLVDSDAKLLRPHGGCTFGAFTRGLWLLVCERRSRMSRRIMS